MDFSSLMPAIISESGLGKGRCILVAILSKRLAGFILF